MYVVRRPAPVPGEEDLAGVRRAFDSLATADTATLLIGRCLPTAAFSRRDLLLPGIEGAQSVARELGFDPAVRHVGGHLAAYDEGSLVLHLWAPHAEPARDLHTRFAVLSGALRASIHELGVDDVRIGAIPGEYCDGEWSVNAGGVAKLAGTGQRIGRHGWLWSAVVTVSNTDALREVLVRCYEQLDLELDPTTVGALADELTGVSMSSVGDAVREHLAAAVREHGLLG